MSSKRRSMDLDDIIEIKTEEKPKMYIFGRHSYDSFMVEQIVMARNDTECIEKVFSNYDLFDEMFKENLLRRCWYDGGLYETLQIVNKWKRDYWTTEESDKIENDKHYRRRLVEENKDTLFGWFPTYYKDSENCGCLDVTVYEKNVI